MKLLTYVLNDVDLLQPVLDELSATGIKGCTIFDSGGMGRERSKRPDMFNIVLGFAANKPDPKTTKTLMLVLKEERIPDVIAAIEAVVGRLDLPGSGILFTQELEIVKGLKL